MPSPSASRRLPLLLGGIVLVLFAGFWVWQSAQTASGLVVYCAHDLAFAEPLLRTFEEQTGIPVTIVGDTEASKSLGLVRRIAAESDAPQCDVFWNNQQLGMMQLAADGLLETHRGPEWERTPPRFRDEDGYWCGFGGRLRVIVSRADAAASPGNARRQLAIADPMFGTTLTHAALMWDQLGAAGFAAWFDASTASPTVTFVPGNGPACRLVVDGKRDAAWTDTDDAYSMRQAQIGAGETPVDVAVYRWPSSFAADFPDAAPSGDDAVRGTILIPNTVAIVAGTSNRSDAERLINWLLSSETEAALARSGSFQVPLKPADEPLPKEIVQLERWAADAIDLAPLLDARREVLAFLTKRAAGEVSER